MKYLTTRSYLPTFVLTLYQTLYHLIDFFSFFSLSGQHNNEICFLVHRRKVLDQITSARLDIEIRLDIDIYLHGLTVYSLNSNFAYYCAIEEYIQCSPHRRASSLNSRSNPKSAGSRRSLQIFSTKSSNLFNKQMILTKTVSPFCRFVDLFSPNYFQRLHPSYGLPMEYLYYEISKQLTNCLPRTLQENIAPINRQTALQLELLYYTNLGNQIRLNLYQSQLPSETLMRTENNPPEPQRICAVLTGNPLKFSETMMFHFFNLSLLLFTLMFGLNALVQRQKPDKLKALLPVLLVSSLFSLLATELIVSLYCRFIKRHSRFINIRLFEISLKQQCISFAFVFCLLLSTFSLLVWSTTLAALLKQHSHQSAYLHYEFGFASLFLDACQSCTGHSDYVYQRETLFLLALFYLAVFLMLRFWTLLITLVRLAIARLAHRYYQDLALKLVRTDPPIKVLKMASITSLTGEERPPEKSKKKRKGRTTQSALDREMENNLLKYFTKK